MTMMAIITIDKNSQWALLITKLLRHCDKSKNSLNVISELQNETQFCLLLFMLLLLLSSS
jgi:hypothetical protein